jgi:peptide-methionine (R)-S-oxide reductase
MGIPANDDEWRMKLTPEQFRVLRKHGTERAGTSPLEP